MRTDQQTLAAAKNRGAHAQAIFRKRYLRGEKIREGESVIIDDALADVSALVAAVEERLRVNVGLLQENADLKRRLRDIEQGPKV